MDREALYRDPYPVYARARAAPGLTFSDELDAWLVARYADVREVLSRPGDFSSQGALRPDVLPGPRAFAELAGAPGGAPVVLSTDGEAHTRYRKPLTRGLSPARVAAALPFVRTTAAGLLASFARAGQAEWMAAYARPLPAAVIGHLLGLDPADVPGAVRAGHRAEELLFTPMPEDEQVAAAREVAALRHLLDRHARASLARDNLAGDLARALTDPNEVVSNTENLLLAGHLTTTALLGTVVHHLLRDRRQWELLRARPDLVPAAIEEAARYEAPVQGFRRTVTRPLTLSGTKLAAGETVFVSFGSAGRDATVFDRPDTFDITREPVRHLSFGHGVHGCPGALLAREQLRITLELLVRELPGLRLAGEDVTMAATLIHRAPERLHLVW
ncbi:putative cytochrome P450 hydroxylase [[Actinomadura] parvosata subsp. kistnae]|uniref:Cytochrome n=1 Tax=[Actinomadura] parvosata subsp. kistnae TaxID=1909395 RepID=A0A1V0AK92_9ACTN|nr:cytochrome P450 [Nonomuraea sp. ATCC 55076]AQZ70641.1 cytochrome [Nonomuraea sp. ATCC 55076]SPM00083.1 putative cytochrome P450 hydroxylase [Actinomadura parvosata subsp. kistnae]